VKKWDRLSCFPLGKNEMKKHILGVIPARGGSKGIKNKNIVELAGKPLIAFTIEAALACTMLSDVIVSTDSEKIAEIATRFGADAPFLRPKELSNDDSSTIDVIKHAVIWYEQEKKQHVDTVVILQPTAPLRTVKDIDSSIRIFLNNPGADSLISCYNASSFHPRIMYRKTNQFMTPYITDQDDLVRRQKFEIVYIRNGAIYILTRKLVMEEGRIIGTSPIGYIMPRKRSVNIDEQHDLELAEFYINRQKQ
jgi:CMP-N,N'-diacetyllegionaminic acid synthase